MHSSIVLSVLCAGLAIASPIVKKALTTEIITDVVTVYVTEGDPTSTLSSSSSITTTVEVTLTSIFIVDPPPPTTTEPPPAPVTTEAPPSPATTEAPPPPPTTEAPPAQPTTEAPAPIQPAAPSAAPAVVAADPSAGLPTGTDFVSTILYHHNIHRRNHSAPDATYDTTIAGYAAQVAASCHYAHDLSPGGGGYGQNIAAYGTTDDAAGIGAAESAASAITDMWYNGEVNSFLPSYYGQDNPPSGNFDAWGHFTQIVWQESASVGCAAQLCPAGDIFSMATWFTVCNYLPAGNVDGGYGQNVLTPVGDPTVTS